jgi:hypothetical protein
MDKRRPQADSTHQTGLKPILHALLIVVESGDRGGVKKLPEFFVIINLGMFLLVAQQPVTPSNKRRAQTYSARQIGLETTLMDFLIVVRDVITGGEEVRAEFFALMGL